MPSARGSVSTAACAVWRPFQSLARLAGARGRIRLDEDELAVDGQGRAAADKRAGGVAERLVVQDAAVREAARREVLGG